MNAHTRVETRHKIFSYLIAGIIATVYFLAAFTYIHPVYAINDDRAMYRIVSGEMTGTPDGHAIFILYPLSWFMSKLFKIVSFIDWYSVIMIGCMVFCLILLLYRALCLSGKKKYLYVVGILALFHILMFEHIIQFQFTIVAAILGGTTIIWIMTMEQDRYHLGEVLTGVFLIFLTVCVRESVFFMCAPFIVLAFFYKNVKLKEVTGKKRLEIKRISAVIISIAVFAGTLGIDTLAYKSEEWQEYKEFNSVRSQIFDYYGFPSYDQYRDFYSECGISEEEYLCLVSYNLIMDFEDLPQKMERIAEKSNEIYIENFEENLHIQFQNAIILLTSSDLYIYNSILLLCFVFMLILLLRYKRKTAFMTWAMGLIVYFGELLYLIIKGRLILRVVDALDIVFILFTMSILFIHWKEYTRWLKRVACAMILLGVGVLGLNMSAIKSSTWELQYGNEVLAAITGYCNQREDNFYFSFGEARVSTRDVKLFRNEEAWNYTGFGGWTANSPLERERLERAGIESVEQAIIDREDVYIIGADTEITSKESALRSYLDSKYQNVEWEQVDFIDLYFEDYIVWKVSVTEN